MRLWLHWSASHRCWLGESSSAQRCHCTLPPPLCIHTWLPFYLMITHTCCYSCIISHTAIVAFLSITNKTKIRTPLCTIICLAPHSAIIYIIYDLTDDTPLYSPASSRLQTLLLCHIEISNMSSTYRQHPTTHLFQFSPSWKPRPSYYVTYVVQGLGMQRVG